MPSTREPIQLLEPSDLLEPLDLTDHHPTSVHTLIYSDYSGTPRATSAPTSARGSPAGAVRRGRRALKSALIGAGALACFGAGAALSQFPGFPFVDSGAALTMARSIAPPPQTAEGPAQPAAAGAVATAEDTKPAATANSPAASSNSTDQSAGAAAQPASAPQAPPCDARGPSKDDSCLAGATVRPAAATANPAASSDPAAISAPAAAQPPAQADNPPPAERPRAEARSDGEKEQRAQSSRHSRRTVRRDTAARRTAEGTAQTERFFDRWQDRDAARWQDRDADRAYGWRPDRYDPYARGDDRGVRAWRDDQRTTGRAVREEAPPMFAPFRSGW